MFAVKTDLADELLTYNKELKEAYRFIQLLRYHFTKRIYEGFQEIIKTMIFTLPQSFKKKFQIFHHYHSEIANTFKLKLFNGATEGLNNKIKLIKRIAFSYRNFYNFRVCIYL